MCVWGGGGGPGWCVNWLARVGVSIIMGVDRHVIMEALMFHIGKAIDMSLDHKPTDQIELDRITRAGGRVGPDSRVNGGLNLSRALGTV